MTAGSGGGCPKCGAGPREAHHIQCPARKKNIKVVSDPRAGTPIVVDPRVQEARDRLRAITDNYVHEDIE